MSTQIVFKAGNSYVVAIPKALGFKPGEKVVVEEVPHQDMVIIKKAAKSQKDTKSSADKEFKKWWDAFLKENEGVLDELAVR